MAFAPGDRVHIVRLGSGVVREVRNGGRYVIEIKGRTMIVEGDQIQRAEAERRKRGKSAPNEPYPEATSSAPASLDLHGKTVEESVVALDVFLNDAILASLAEVRVIHGKSGGRVKSAVHRRLRELPPVRSFRVDPGNSGVTIVSL